ncbi:hypothetical protein M409DRAFT_52632 [Zasmidium cellare ATCC 36951]|uniref:non-specific serine/threonine protein kinase n=1 Tax=Zasmidium cellare ATCC 36951 TaxID=1080233 RepID=A0A6A6CRQ7_ZASCE|nr:uncharacterized protein M409DRAFT_52632 [Zasmidium cellare ATCC 36951]KAF2169383.1 hypothetical protein M409DRAFT_52632 [Zasmidium cellare ATCC 36951]
MFRPNDSRPRPGTFEEPLDSANDAAAQADHARRRSFSRFIGADVRSERLRDEIEEWHYHLAYNEPLYNSFVRDARALIEHIETINADLNPLETTLPTEVADGARQHTGGTLLFSQAKTLEDRLKQFKIRRNGLVAFHERLRNRFGGFASRLAWINANLDWRQDQIQRISERMRLDELLKTMATIMKKLRPSATTASIAATSTIKEPRFKGNKVAGKYPDSMLRAADYTARERARTAPSVGLGSIPLDPPPPTLEKRYHLTPKDSDSPTSDSATSETSFFRKHGYYAVTHHRWTADLVHPWNIAKTFAGGSDTTKIRLCVRTDANNAVVDRIVEKNTYFKEFPWARTTNWVGQTPATTSDEKELVPVEWFTQAKLSSRSDTQVVVGVRSYPRISLQQRIMRMYVEYCGEGDLNDVFSAYHLQQGYVPLPFLWVLFKALVEGGLLMKKGSTTEAVDDWKEIVHRDLKTGNVFLDVPDPGDFPLYPRPKLADFGLAILASEDDTTNPVLYNTGEGTRGFKAPEQIRWVDDTSRQPVDSFKVLSPANVFGIGMIMRSLMCLSYEDDEIPVRCLTRNIANRTVYEPFGEDTVRQYGMDICNKVEQCLLINPDERPALESLNEQLEEVMVTDKGVRDAQASDVQAGETRETLLGRKEVEYKIGMALQPRTTPFGATDIAAMEKVADNLNRLSVKGRGVRWRVLRGRVVKMNGVRTGD